MYPRGGIGTPSFPSAELHGPWTSPPPASPLRAWRGSPSNPWSVKWYPIAEGQEGDKSETHLSWEQVHALWPQVLTHQLQEVASPACPFRFFPFSRFPRSFFQTFPDDPANTFTQRNLLPSTSILSRQEFFEYHRLARLTCTTHRF